MTSFIRAHHLQISITEAIDFTFMGNIEFVLFDAASTLIHKSELWARINVALANHGITVNE